MFTFKRQLLIAFALIVKQKSQTYHNNMNIIKKRSSFSSFSSFATAETTLPENQSMWAYQSVHGNLENNANELLVEHL